MEINHEELARQREELVKQRKELDRQIAEMNPNAVRFSVDASIIDRLGDELVGRAVTAVAELVKNAYDADATEVEIEFQETSYEGGTVVVSDNGSGMTRKQLIDGFMRISSTEKVREPVSKIFRRQRAGRKGIGRFAAQRLGRVLTILTKADLATPALKLTLDWTKYQPDQNLESIEHQLLETEEMHNVGTQLVISNLREAWSIADIERVDRYIADLLQPSLLSEREEKIHFARKDENSFSVKIYQTADGQKKTVSDSEENILEQAVATIQGYVDKAGDAYFSVIAPFLGIKDEIIWVPKSDVELSKAQKESLSDADLSKAQKFSLLPEVHFKAHYFILDRPEYYRDSPISKVEQKKFKTILSNSGGIRLYRNGFRVLPYGEKNDDWLRIDANRFRRGPEISNIPFANRSFMGFVEVHDSEDKLFKETSSREGVRETLAFDELRDFVFKTINAALLRVAAAIYKKLQGKRQLEVDKPDAIFQTINELIEKLKRQIEKEGSENVRVTYENLKIEVARIEEAYQKEREELMEEANMLRVLASVGLSVGVFAHEIKQVFPGLSGFLESLKNQADKPEIRESVKGLKMEFDKLERYASYFAQTVYRGTSRDLKPIHLYQTVNEFIKVLEADLKRAAIEVKIESYGFDPYTIPMHRSEWNSVLFNLYTNAKKAIRRANISGKIRIVVEKTADTIKMEFSDNGDGIPPENRERIFDAFFTTGSHKGADYADVDEYSGIGLGLKIVRDIIESYQGEISVIEPEGDFSTCFLIEIPSATPKHLHENGL